MNNEQNPAGDEEQTGDHAKRCMAPTWLEARLILIIENDYHYIRS
ncbi:MULTISPECIES: hypothetical protein [unclassified Herbaspirillum]